ncbi:uncharacterized protein A8950_2391 [Dongia mobilis]|uniref:TPM domain-containing protein n=1 Tax=Dongia mobilis TaxID=578943 RepID=A0A4R6WLA1_9PROT|nr:TPM domain-containing protein [Dongia mobilis]TDQ81326.1 uncharacterized protein A8950_2391 [Dongia mobilis]
MGILPRALLLLGLILIAPLRSATAEPAVPPLTGRVVDLAAILSETEERDISQQLAVIERNNGTQIVVVTLATLAGYEIEEWGLALGRNWKIGRAGKDDGIVIVVAPRDRAVRIEVGYGLEGRIPDATAHRIIRSHMLLAFREAHYGDGIKAALNALQRSLAGIEAPAPSAATKQGGKLTVLLVVLGLFGFVGLFGWIFYLITRNFDESQVGTEEKRSERSDPPERFRSSSRSLGGRSASFGGRGGSFGGGGATGRW